eukprot:scaffold34469_cov34-Tisochrysis_lutea.AAC.1
MPKSAIHYQRVPNAHDGTLLWVHGRPHLQGHVLERDEDRHKPGNLATWLVGALEGGVAMNRLGISSRVRTQDGAFAEHCVPADRCVKNVGLSRHDGREQGCDRRLNAELQVPPEEWPADLAE